ncbi:hypothetical protein HMPREF0063_12030 [Aeromicrobium marinum DSM 15272]|uniref:Uncharacterized protein n=1 Tax=Aeromicrobium marinum DSM 15272 TaxID=585531 RepID=E2SE94_9ACTN|nr:hypothetical protein HMPREF0063_12030 [Aeromicrobium marinum DSM 15272]
MRVPVDNVAARSLPNNVSWSRLIVRIGPTAFLVGSLVVSRDSMRVQNARPRICPMDGRSSNVASAGS